MNEFEQKQQRLQALLTGRQLDALLLQRVSSFAWITGGAASYVNTAVTTGAASLLITPAGRYLITNNIEATRLEQEEKLKAQGWEFCIAPWHETNPTITQLTAGLRLGADGPYPGATDLSAEIARLRVNLTPAERERCRELGRLCAEAMAQAARAVRPGMSEYEIAGRLSQEAQSRGVQAIVNLIATDRLPHRLEVARELGAEVYLATDGREGDAIWVATGRKGVDVAFEVAGENGAVDAAIAAARPGSRVVLTGIPAEERTSFRAATARRKGLTLKLVRRMKHVYPRAIRLVESGLVDVRSLVTHRFPFDQFQQAFATAERREGLKVIVGLT